MPLKHGVVDRLRHAVQEFNRIPVDRSSGLVGIVGDIAK
jgi:hypothetical protein